jgi:hypothetical protein
MIWQEVITMATATIHICDICGKEDKKPTEFKLHVSRNGGEVVREMDLCVECNENLEKVVLTDKAPPKVTSTKKEKKKPVIDLVKEVFAPVVERVKERSEDLKGLQRRRLHAFYLAGWLSEVILEVLQDSDVDPQLSARGTEISFADQLKIALKGSATSDFDWIVKKGVIEPGVPVLFLSGGKDKETIGQLNSCADIKVLTYEYFNDGEDDWIIGLIKRT